MFRLTDKVAVVTGGASGIGKAISLLFALQGAEVHVIDFDESATMGVIDEITKTGTKAFFYQCDVSDQKKVISVFEKIGKVDILINNVGIAHIGKADSTRESDFDRVMKINVNGVYNCLYAAIPKMKNTGGVILNTSSIVAHVGIPDRFAYSASKGAVHAMTLSVARDYVQDNIRCNSISPARIHTPFVDGFIAKNFVGKEMEQFEKLSKSQPIGRMGTPEEVASLALYLCSDIASFITGCDYPIDGGFITINN